jgi:hypothetical protein
VSSFLLCCFIYFVVVVVVVYYFQGEGQSPFLPLTTHMHIFTRGCGALLASDA